MENKDGIIPENIYELYAKDELKMDKNAAVEFANKVDYEVLLNEEDTEDSNKFLIWLYINNMAKKRNS